MARAIVSLEFGPRRIEQRQNAEERPGALLVGAGDADGPVAFGGELVDDLVRLRQIVALDLAEAEDDLRRALGDVERLARLLHDRRLGALAHRIEGNVLRLSVVVQHGFVLQAGHHREVDRVLIRLPRRERGGEDHRLRIGTAPGLRLAEGELVLGERAGLVRAQDVDAGHLLDRLQPGDDRLLLRQPLRAERHRHRQHRRHRHRHRGDEQDQHELGEPQEVGAAHQLDADQDGRQHNRDDDQEVADAHHRLLEVRDGAGALHQLGGASEEGVAAGRGSDRDHLALLDDGAGVGRIAGLLADRQRLAGERRLIDAEVVALQQLAVRRHDVADVEAHDVAGNEGLRLHFLPGAVAQRARLHRQRTLQRIEGVRSLVLLPEAENGVEHQQRRDDDEIAPVPHDQRHQRRRLDHPGDRSPEKAEEDGELALLFLFEGVRAVLAEALCRLRRGQPLCRIDRQRLERILDGHRVGSVGLLRHLGSPPCRTPAVASRAGPPHVSCYERLIGAKSATTGAVTRSSASCAPRPLRMARSAAPWTGSAHRLFG